MSDNKITAETYLVIVPEIVQWGSNKPWVRSARVDRLRTGKPSLARGEIAVRVKLHFDEQAMIDAIPVVEADVRGFLTAPEPTLETE